MEGVQVEYFNVPDNEQISSTYSVTENILYKNKIAFLF